MICNNSLYGNYRTRSFTDIYPTEESFVEGYKGSKLNPYIPDINIITLYYLLYSKYGNSHVANSDENQFKYKVYSTIFQYGHTWVKKLDIQSNLRGLSEDDIRLGSKNINNRGFNPSTTPSTATLDELLTINEQSTNAWKKSKLEGLATLYSLLVDDVTEDFLNKFKKLFLVIVEPQLPLWYETELTVQEEE